MDKIDEIRAALTGPMRIPIGAKDRKGTPIYIGDTIKFMDAQEWGSHDLPCIVTGKQIGRAHV